MKRIAIILAAMALAQPTMAQDGTQVYVNANGQITGVGPAGAPDYLKYQYQPVECVTLPCPNYFVLAADSPSDDGVVVWRDEAAPEIIGSKKVISPLVNLDDGPACWVIRGDLVIAEEGTTLQVHEVVADCT